MGDDNISSAYRLSFRVRHPQLLADKISSELRLHPRHQWNVGERAKNKENEEFGPIKRDTYCSYDVDYGCEVSGIANEVSRFLDDIEHCKEFLWQISNTGGAVSLYLAWFISNQMSGEIFTSPLLKRVSDLKISLEIEIYPDMRAAEPS